MLYAYFLEIAKEIIYEELHEKLKFTEETEKMYNYIQENKIEQKIKDCTDLKDIQKKIIFPENQTIELLNLDGSIYLGIINFIEGKKFSGLIKYMKKTRNDLCHLSAEELQNDMSQNEFAHRCKKFTFDLKYFGIKNDLLRRCWKNILKREHSTAFAHALLKRLEDAGKKDVVKRDFYVRW